MFTFHYAPDTCALASHIVLRDVGADFTLRRIDFATKQQQGADYLRLNPKGRVPVLETPGGPLTETPAILIYLAQMFPAAGLAPLDDPFALAELQAVNSYLCSTLHVAHAHRMRGYRWVDADDTAAIAAMQKKVPDSVGAAWAHVEAHVMRGPLVMGETYTVADPYLFTLAQWIEADGVDPARFPKVIAHRERMRARPNVRAALAAERA